jgi:NADH-quinone oxidoreductase subunit G
MTDTAAPPAGAASPASPGDGSGGSAPAADPVLGIVIDGRHVTARPGELVIDAAERAGVYIPRFCYHPRMDPVGMCRMCLVEISGPRGFSLQPSCYIRVSEGLEVLTHSDKARKAQEGVLEFLLVNHPLDCPVCDKGGECPLQDQAISHGPGESRFIEEKRHFDKPIEIGPLVLLDRERCIQCARCTRFAAEVAGEAQIDFAGRGDLIEVAPFPEQPFSSYFSGNTVQICPVGALTATPYRFKSRPWDLEQVETTCTSCSFGCRVVAQSSAGALVRYLGIDADPVNQSWLCDKGRYSFEAVHAADRLRQPLVRRSGELVQARWHEALREVVAGVRQAHNAGAEGSIAVLGGARLSNEDAYAWSRLARSVLRTDSVDAQLADGLPAELVLGLPRATIDQACSARAVVLLAGDLRDEVPVLYLRLRDAALRGGLTLIECSPVPTSLSALARAHLGYLPGDAARLVDSLVATPGARGAPPIADEGELETARQLLGLTAASATPAGAAAGSGAGAATVGEGVVVVLGRSSLAESEESVAAAAAALARALPGARFLPALRRSNVFGALDMGLAPGLLPGRVSLDEGGAALGEVWGELPARGLGAAAMLEAAAAGELSMLVLLGADPIADFPDAALARRALSTVPFLVAVGTHPDASNALADVVLPVAGADERAGTTTNLEGRVSLLAQKVVPPGMAWPAWTVAAELALRLGSDLGFENAEGIWEEITRVAPSHRGASAAVLTSLGRRDGVVLPLPGHPGQAQRPIDRIDPMATPGIISVEEQGAPLRVGSALALGADGHETARGPEADGEGTPRQALLSWPPSEGAPLAPQVPALAPGQLRLVLRRRLYDRGTLVQSSPSLAPLAAQAELALAPLEFERLGAVPGGRARLRRVAAPGERPLPSPQVSALAGGDATPVGDSAGGDSAGGDNDAAGGDDAAGGTGQEVGGHGAATGAVDAAGAGDGGASKDEDGGAGLEVVLIADASLHEGIAVLGVNLAGPDGATPTWLLRAGTAVQDVTLEVIG